MTALVTLPVAKAHLRVDHADDDADIQMKMEQASEIVIDYLKRPDHGWTDATVPMPVQAATLIMLSKLYDDRSADQAGGETLGQSEAKHLPSSVTSLLHRMRDPALA